MQHWCTGTPSGRDLLPLPIGGYSPRHPCPPLPALNRPALLPIALIVFVDVLGYAAAIPLLPLYAERYGATPAQVGLLISSYGLCALVAAPLLGRCSDRWGRKPVLLLSQAGSLLGFVMLAWAPSLAWVFAARILDGATAANVLTARAYIADVTEPRHRSAAFGLISAAFGFGYMLGPAGVGLLAQWGPRAPLWAAAALSATSLLCTLWLLPSTRPPAGVAGTAPSIPWAWRRQPELAVRLWQLGGFLLAFSLFTSGIALFCERRLQWNGAAFGPVEVGWVLAYVGALSLAVQLLALRRLVQRYGEARLIRAALVLGAVGYAGLGLAHSLPVLLACLALTAIGNSLLRPSLQGLLSQLVPPDRQGQLSGLMQSLQSLALVVAPLLAGLLIGQGWLSAWALACACSLVFVLLQASRRDAAAAG